MRQDNDGNIIYVKLDESGGISNTAGFVQKYNSEGDLLWQYGEDDYFDGSNSHFLDFAMDSENNVYVVGTQFDANDQYPKTEIIKVSASGEEVWRTNFTTTFTWSEAIEQIEITSDDRILLIARLYDAQIETLSMALIEIDTDGNTVQMFQDTDYTLPLEYLHITTNDEVIVFNDYNLKKINLSFETLFNYDFSEDMFAYYFATNYDFYASAFSNESMYLAHTIATNNGPVNSFAVSSIPLDGSEPILNTIAPFPAISDMLSVVPTYIYTNDEGAIYVCGFFYYGEGNGSGFPTTDATATTQNHGGKGGSSVRREFVAKLNSDLTLAWSKDYNFMSQWNDALPAGGFFHQNRFVYQTSIQNGQTVLPYFIAHDDSNGETVWTYTEQPSELFNTFQPSSLISGIDGDVYTFGRGELYIEDQLQYQGRYLSRYTLSDFVGINPSMSEMRFNVYPNPTTAWVYIESNAAQNQVTIYDQLGQKLLSRWENSARFYVDLSTLSSGLYILQCNDKTLPIIKQ